MDNATCHAAVLAKLEALASLSAAQPGLRATLAVLNQTYGATAARCLIGGAVDARPDLCEAVLASGLLREMERLKARALAAAIPAAATRRAEREIEQATADYEAVTLTADVTECVYDICSCGMRMSVDEADSCLVCEDCGMVRPLEGIIFEESQIYAQEGQKTKSGRFDPLRHLRTWLNQIQAVNTRPVEETEVAIAAELIREKARQENEIVAFLTVACVRRHLKELGKAALNPHVSLLLKKLTGRGPPALPPAVEARIIEIFSQELAMEGTGPPDGPHNIRMYYPNYIRRILDTVLPPRSRYRAILDFIHIQDPDGSQRSTASSERSWRQTRAVLDPALFQVIPSAV